ncbi:MAG TPA: hypothetical protein VML54_06495 [Candidatus Limnocylindrales bacterium]|nr:hypothetical protein [Candidatus Limnocylindrales bacterium]
MPSAPRPDRQLWSGVRVACLWLPQLPLRIEVLRRPAIDGRPLVLGGGPGERRVVQLCSPEAERAGIRAGLPLREVPTLCRDAVVISPDPVRTAAILDGIVAALQRVSPIVEPAGEHVFLDLRGLSALYRTFDNLAYAISAPVAPLLTPRVGLACGKFAAALAARFAVDLDSSTSHGVTAPHGLKNTTSSAPLRHTPIRHDAPIPHPPSITQAVPQPSTLNPQPASWRLLPQHETAAFLAPLPVSHLPLEPDAVERLNLLGLRTIGDLAALPIGAVQAQLGLPGARAWRLANGRDDEPVVPRPVRQVVRAVLQFEDPLASVEAVLLAVDRLLVRVFADPALRARAVRAARLRALLSDGTSWERLFTFKEPLSDRVAVHRSVEAKLRLPNGLPPAAIEELCLEMLDLAGEAARQGNLFLAQALQLGKISAVARQLGARYGRVPIYHAVEVEPWSRVPERRWALKTCDL